MKQYLSLGVLFLFAQVLAIVPAAAQETPPAVVITKGTHTMKATPDRAIIMLMTEARARRPQEAQQQNARAMSAVIEKLKAGRMAESAIRTVHVSLDPEFDYQEGRQTLRGYVARNTVEVTVDDLVRLGPVMDIAVAAGATSVSGVRFDVRNRDALERDALELATRDALARAEAAARGANRAIAHVQQIVEGGPEPPPRALIMGARAEAAAELPTPIVPGEIEIRAEVTVTAVLK